MIQRLLALILVAGILIGLPASVIGQDAANTGVTIHVVQRGENLFRIALSYGLTVDEIASLNGITDPSNIQVGQRLLVPLNSATTATQPRVHVIQPGETLRSIADLYGITADDLALSNNISDVNTIFVGQVLNIDSESTATPTAPVIPNPSDNIPINPIYVVATGDTLFRIATSFGVTVNDLARANNIVDPTVIYAGEPLIIPGVEPPQLALDLPPVVSSFDVKPLILVEGRTARIRLVTTAPMNVSGTFLSHSVNVASEMNNTLHTILVGIPVFTDAGVYPLSLLLADGSNQQIKMDVNLQIVSGGYGNETIALSPELGDLLNPNVEGVEYNLLQSLMNAFTPMRYFDGPMGLPAAASITSSFGMKRSYNGGPFDHYHMGTDFAGAPGSPILASASGVVVLADALNVRGNATVIDHGWGVYTGYWHQTEQYVQVGDFVTAGQVIGTIGSTGRVTGPHLHWELWVNGTPVEPMQWVQDSFSS